MRGLCVSEREHDGRSGDRPVEAPHVVLEVEHLDAVEARTLAYSRTVWGRMTVPVASDRSPTRPTGRQ